MELPEFWNRKLLKGSEKIFLIHIKFESQNNFLNFIPHSPSYVLLSRWETW